MDAVIPTSMINPVSNFFILFPLYTNPRNQRITIQEREFLSICPQVWNSQLNSVEFPSMTTSHDILDWEMMKSLLPRRARDADKSKFGHVLVIGGDYGMGGAVRMAAEAAMRVGAGLVSVATRPEHVPVVSSSRPEIMCHQVEKPEELTALLNKATVVVIGPGLGKTDWAKMLLDTVLAEQHPKLLDADALNLLSEYPTRSDDWVLTPHPGEASRLLDTSVASPG